MVSLQLVQQSNARISSTLPQGLVALFLGATSGIGQSILQQFVENAPPSPRIYTVARPQSAASHEDLLASLRQASPTADIKLITADVSLVREVDKIVGEITKHENKLDLLVMSPGFMAFEGRKDTREGLEPSMSTRYYSRQRAVEQLLPLLKNASAPRVLTVLAGGLEQNTIDVTDLDVKNPNKWHFWTASVHATTMHTLSLERVAHENPELSILHWFPGTVATPGLARAARFGMSPPNPMSLDESGARGLFLATSDLYGVHGGLVPTPQGLKAAQRSGGGIFLVDPAGEITHNEKVLSGMREKGIDKLVWDFTQETFSRISGGGPGRSSKDEL